MNDPHGDREYAKSLVDKARRTDPYMPELPVGYEAVHTTMRHCGFIMQEDGSRKPVLDVHIGFIGPAEDVPEEMP